MNIDIAELIKIAAKSLRIAGHPVVIDRPKGYEKVFPTAKGPVTLKYPLAYGYFKGIVNPQDKEEADVFIGEGGKLHGRVMKGDLRTGTWKPDEYKWYTGFTDDDYKKLTEFFKEPGLLRDNVTFPSRKTLLSDVKTVAEKRAFWKGFIKASKDLATAAPLPAPTKPTAPINQPNPDIPLHTNANNNFSVEGFSPWTRSAKNTIPNTLSIDAHGQMANGPLGNHYEYAVEHPTPGDNSKYPQQQQGQPWVLQQLAKLLGQHTNDVHNVRAASCNADGLATPAYYQRFFPNVTNVTMQPTNTVGLQMSTNATAAPKDLISNAKSFYANMLGNTNINPSLPHEYQLENKTNWVDKGERTW